VLVALGAISWSRFGSATPMTAHALVPSTSLKDVIFWSTIAYAYSGFESASTMGDEIEEPRRTLPRAILTAGVALTAFYLVCTYAVLLAVPPAQISGLQGFMQAIDTMARRVNAAWLIPPVAVLVTLTALGGVGSWFAATARIPFVAGLDRFLPAAFGRLHPRWRTPYVALLVQAALATIFVVLGQAGTSVRGAYEVLVSMAIISYFIPFLYMFAAMIVLQREPLPAGGIATPGGPPVARLLGAVGFVTTAVSIVVACVPSDSEPDKTLAVVKVVGSSIALIAIGVVIYALGRRFQREPRA
jgi:amino acid transporter